MILKYCLRVPESFPFFTFRCWLVSRVQLFMTPWTVAHQAPLSMGVSRQEYWSGLPCSPPGDFPNSGIKPVSPVSPALQAYSLPTEPPGKQEIQKHGIAKIF